jgi:hypothetical protein
MTYIESMGLIALAWCVFLVLAWLRLRRATRAPRRTTLAELRTSLYWLALLIVPIGLSVILLTSPRPSSLEVLGVPLVLLLLVGIALNELRADFRARNAAQPCAPADRDT